MKKRKPAATNDEQKPAPELELEAVIGLHAGSEGIAYSQNGSADVAYCAGCVVVVYDARANTQKQFLKAAASAKPIVCVAFSPDGAHLAAGEMGAQPAVLVWDLLTGNCVAEMKGHKHGVSSVCFSPSGNHLVSSGATYDGQICFWNWQSKALLTKERAQVELRSVTFSEDGSCVISSGRGHMRVWTVSQVGGGGVRQRGGSHGSVTLTGRSPVLGPYKGHTIMAVEASKGGSIGHPCFFAVSGQGVLMQLKTNSRGYDRSVDLKVREAHALATSEGAVAVGCSDGIVRLFASRNLTFKSTLPRPAAHGDHGLTDQRLSISTALRPGASNMFPSAVAVAFDTSGDRLAVVYADHSLFIWDIKDTSKIGRYRSMLAHSAPIWDICSLPSPQFPAAALGHLSPAPPPGTIATCSADGTLRLWNLGQQPGGVAASTTGLAQLSGGWARNTYSKQMMGVIYANTRLPSGADKAPRGRPEDQPVGGRAAAAAAQPPPVLKCLRASPDGKQIAAGDKSGNLRVFDVSAMKESSLLEAHDAEILSLDFSPAGSTGGYLLASGSRDHLVHVYDSQRGYQRLATLDQHNAAVTSVKFADRGQRLITCGADRRLIFRNLGDEAGDAEGDDFRKSEVDGRGPLYDMQLETTERYVMTTGEDKKLRVYDVDSGRAVKSFPLPTSATAGEAVRLHIDPAGITVAASHSDRRVRLYDFYTGQILGVATGHGEVVTGALITPDCTQLVTVAGDSCVFVWRLPKQLSSDSITRLAELAPERVPIVPAPQPPASLLTQAPQSSEPLALTPADDGETRCSKRERLVTESSRDDLTATGGSQRARTPPLGSSGAVDPDSVPLTSERLRRGGPLVSATKLPKWARSSVDASAVEDETLPSGGSEDSKDLLRREEAGEDATSAEPMPWRGALIAAAPAGKWQQHAIAGVELPERRLTENPAELQALPPAQQALLASPGLSASPSHPTLAAQAEDDDQIVIYDDEEDDASSEIPKEKFDVVHPPADLPDSEPEDPRNEEDFEPDLVPEDEDSGDESFDLPRTNLFKEHFGLLLDDGPLPPPAPDSREAARQSFSTHFRLADAIKSPASSGENGSQPPQGAAEGGSELQAQRAKLKAKDRKGRMGSDLQDMRSRLVDLGLSFARQQTEARRGRTGASTAVDVKAPEGDFCVGAIEQRALNPVAEAVDELQHPARSPTSPPRLTRSSSGGRKKMTAVAKSKSQPPLPQGPPPPSAVSLSSNSPLSIAAKQSAESQARRSTGEEADGQQTGTPVFTAGTQFANPAFNLTPGTGDKGPLSPGTATMKLIKEGEAEADAVKPMKPGHQVVECVYSSVEALLPKLETVVQPDDEKALPAVAATPQAEESGTKEEDDRNTSGLRHSFMQRIQKLKNMGRKPSGTPGTPTSAATPSEAAPATGEATEEKPTPQPSSVGSAAPGSTGDTSVTRSSTKDVSILRGKRIRGGLRASSTGPELPAGSPDPKASDGKATLVEPAGVRESGAKASTMPSGSSSSVPAAVDAVATLKAAVTQVEAAFAQKLGSAEQSELQAQVSALASRLASLGTPAPHPALAASNFATPGPGVATSPFPTYTPAHTSLKPTTPFTLAGTSLDGTLSAVQVESLLQGSAEKYSELLAQKFEMKLEMRLQALLQSSELLQHGTPLPGPKDQ